MLRTLLRISLIIVAIAGTVRAAAVPPEARSGLDPVRLQLKWHPQFQFAGYYAAKAKGFYEAEGLDVTIIDGGLDRPPIKRVLEGKADFGVSDADIVLPYFKGEPIVALAAIFQHSPYILLTRQDSGIRAPSDLRGKRLMLADEQGLTQLEVLIKREGIDLDQLQVLPHDYDLQQLIDGKVDAISAYATVEPFKMRAQGVEPGMIRALDYGIDFYGDTMFTTREQVQNNPARVAAFLRASLKGWDYAMSNQDEMIDLIANMPGARDRGTTREQLEQEAKATRDLILPGLVDLGHMNPGRWEMIARVYADAGKIPSEHRSLDDFLYRGQVDSLPDWFVPAVAAAGTAMLVSLLAIFWSVQLRRTVAKRTAELHRQIEYGKKTSEQLYFFKWLMDQSADPFYIMSPTKGFRFIYANTAACDHFGLSRPDMLSKSMPEFNPHFTQRSCDELLNNLRERRSLLFETEHRHSSGRTMAVEISTNYLVHDGDEFIAGYFRDITERKRNQDTMTRARQEAEAASRAKDHFLAMLSHELRTPLTPVLAEVSALREDGQTPSHLLPTLEMIDRNIRLEASLIDDLLDLTRVSKGKLHLNCEPLDVHLALERTVEICQPEIRRQDLDVKLVLNATERVVSGDTARIHQVLWNLLKNATKFTPKRGRITIYTENEPSSTGAPIVRIRFVDNGIGMTKQSLAKIFDAFEQADAAVGRRFGGLGLGLAISRSVVHAHGGTISAESEGHNRGAIFTVRLKTIKIQQPRSVAPDQKPVETSAKTASKARGRRVLLVEDNPDTLRVLERLMTRAGWTVKSAESVAQAIAAANQEDFDILVSDLGLPDGSGFDVMRHLRKREIRGIALSGYGMDEDIARSRAAGFTAHITKPIDFRSLQQVMNSLEQPEQVERTDTPSPNDSRITVPLSLRD